MPASDLATVYAALAELNHSVAEGIAWHKDTGFYYSRYGRIGGSEIFAEKGDLF